MLRGAIGNVGISVIVEYPKTIEPLIAILEERYPRSEAIVVVDMQHSDSPFEVLISQFQLVKVCHNPSTNIRALYRSRCRVFRRVVVVDLPMQHRSEALGAAREIASFGYIIRLRGEICVARNTLSYCANLISSYPLTESLLLATIIGAEVVLERTDSSHAQRLKLVSDRVLAWRRVAPLFLVLALLLPAMVVALAHLSGERLLVAVAAITLLIVLLLLYLSCRVVVEKGLFVVSNTIIENFCRYIVEHIRKIYYLYKERISQSMGERFSFRYLIKRRR
jgi:hypothetical protein